MDDASQHLLKSLTSFGSDTGGPAMEDTIGAGAAAPGCAAYVVPLLHFIGLAMVTAAALRHMGTGSKRQRIAADEAGGDADDASHESSSARSIVFRDDLRRQRRRDPNKSTGGGGGDDIPGYTPAIRPLRELGLGPADSFGPLMERRPTTIREGSIEGDDERVMESELTDREETVLRLLREERAVVKTVKNSDWTRFLERLHGDAPFRTSTSLLPSFGRRMRCYGSSTTYTVGVVFTLPSSFDDSPEKEDAAASSAGVWCWPSGYAAKTEHNVDGRGELVHGRRDALVSVSTLRRSNRSYLYDEEYVIGGRTYQRGGEGFGVAVPYNEMYLRIGGVAGWRDSTDKTPADDSSSSSFAPASPPAPSEISYEAGLGPPIALFVRTATFAHLVSMLRTRARLVATAAPERRSYYAAIPLLFITPERGTIVLTRDMQGELFRRLADEVEPFQNSAVYRAQCLTDPDREHLRQKVQEFFDLDDDAVVRGELTAEERARIAGGFGATDASVVRIFEDASREDDKDRTPSQSGEGRDDGSGDDDEAEGGECLLVRRCVQEGLTSAVRAADAQTARQLLILYYAFAARRSGHRHLGGDETKTQRDESENGSTTPPMPLGSSGTGCHSDCFDPTSCQKWSDSVVLSRAASWDSDATALSRELFLASPPPPPLRTDRLRSATDSDGLLIVLGAAEILRSMHDGVALRRRLQEAASAIEEWIANGEQSLLFRLASWKDQRAAQHDLRIAMERSSNFTAFVGYHAIVNRKKFASLLRRMAENDVVEVDDGAAVTNPSFLRSIHDVVTHMNRPCLRLELLQYILGLDNRYSVAYITDSVGLAAACLTYLAAQSNGGARRKRPLE